MDSDGQCDTIPLRHLFTQARRKASVLVHTPSACILISAKAGVFVGLVSREIVREEEKCLFFLVFFFVFRLRITNNTAKLGFMLRFFTLVQNVVMV